MKENPSYFAVIISKVRYDNDLTDKAKLLYGEITALTSKSGECWASNEYFARLYEVAPETISRNISLLHEKGYIGIKYVLKGCKVEKRIITVDEIVTVDKKINRTVDENVIPTVDENVKENSTSKDNNINKAIKEPKRYADAFESCKIIWNNANYSKISDRDDTFKKKVFKRVNTAGFDLKLIIDRADKSKLIQDKGTWFTFDWIFKNDTNWRKVIDGNYDNTGMVKKEENFADKYKLENNPAYKKYLEEKGIKE